MVHFLSFLRRHSLKYWLLLILVAFLISSAIIVHLAYQIAENEINRVSQEFDAITNLVEESAIDQLERPMRALRGLNALHALDRGFTKDRLRFLMGSGGFNNDYPGILGFGVIARVASDEVENFLARERADQGNDFSVGPLGAGDAHYIIKLVEPREANQAALAGR